MKMFKLPATLILLLLICSTISEVKSFVTCKMLQQYQKECKYGAYRIPGCHYDVCYKGPGERCDRAWHECADGTICVEDEFDKTKKYCYDLSRPLV